MQIRPKTSTNITQYLYSLHILLSRIPCKIRSLGHNTLLHPPPIHFTDRCTTVESVSLVGIVATKLTGFVTPCHEKSTYPSACTRIPLFPTPLHTFPLTHKSPLATLPYWTTLYHMQGFFCPTARQMGKLKCNNIIVHKSLYLGKAEIQREQPPFPNLSVPHYFPCQCKPYYLRHSHFWTQLG